MVENETVTGSLASRTNAIARYGSTYTNKDREIPPTPSEFEREPLPHERQDTKGSGERVRSPAPEWRGTNTAPNMNGNGAKRFHADVGKEKASERMYADFVRQERGGKGGHNVHRNLFSSNGDANGIIPALATPPAGTGRVLGSEFGEEEGLLDGVGDPGRG